MVRYSNIFLLLASWITRKKQAFFLVVHDSLQYKLYAAGIIILFKLDSKWNLWSCAYKKVLYQTYCIIKAVRFHAAIIVLTLGFMLFFFWYTSQDIPGDE